jgi:hypothetical protein
MLRDQQRSDALTTAILDRLRRDGHLVIGASDDEQRARYARSSAAAQDEWRSMCRTLKDAYRFHHGITDEIAYARFVSQNGE